MQGKTRQNNNHTENNWTFLQQQNGKQKSETKRKSK